ncbi:MAG: phosphoadenosine phosphosulfate reductase family protein [Methanotrichaceae archaeon]
MKEKQRTFTPKGRSSRTFAPGSSNIYWCQTCNAPLLSEKCSICGGSGRIIQLSPPADVRLCSGSCRELLKDLFEHAFGYADFLGSRIILLNKIAGIDRRDQVILDGHHIATLWFDITSGSYRLDLELPGAALLASKATKNVVICREALLKGHIKGKWVEKENIDSKPGELIEGDSVILKIGKYVGVGTVRRRGDGSLSVRIKDMTQRELQLSDRIPTLDDIVRANEAHLRRLEKAAVKELKDYLSRTRQPVNISFSGGKDSLVALNLGLKVKPNAEIIFINTQLEFPETVEYVHDFCSNRNLKLHEIREEKNNFFEQIKSFGPPAKDFRWCCKTNKLGPLTTFIQQQYPKGCVTVEGRRIYESFSRSKIGAVEKNPYVPNQTTLCPIRNWKALEVMLYIYWNKLPLNPLYEKDYERIGCWLCPASLQSEFENTKRTHPQLYEKLDSCLRSWAEDNRIDMRYIDWGFWRWKRHPPKIVEIAKAHNVSLKGNAKELKEIRLDFVEGRSPCGIKHSIECSLSVPQNYPFGRVANALSCLGNVKYSEELGTAILEIGDSRSTVFANGHILVVAPKEKADAILKSIIETILRVQTCTHCKICEKKCRRGAISVKDTITVNEKKCVRCSKCLQGCIAASEGLKIIHAIRRERRARARTAK